MKRVVFSIPILILLCSAGCPPTGTATGSTLPAATPSTDCAPAVAATKLTLPAPIPWAGQRLHRPSAPRDRAFAYLATEEATVYSVVIVDGSAVTARFVLDPTALQDFITAPSVEDGDGGGGATTLSPIVKVKGPPRPLLFVVPAPPRPTADDPAYWVRLACLAAGADTSAGGSAPAGK